MESTRRMPTFGLSITPYAANLEQIFSLTKNAEEFSLDLIGIQDHPYNGSFLDTWSLIAALAASTKRLRYFADVTDLPMRPPQMLAKAAGTLDIITKGRVELGIGAGAYWDAINAYGGQRRTPDEAVSAFEEAVQVIRLLWDYGRQGRQRTSFNGKYYRLSNAQTGPRPPHKISIWIGAFKPRMLRVIGRTGDGWVIPMTTYVSSDEIRTSQQIIDKEAEKNSRSPSDIARIGNMVGAIDEVGQLTKSPGQKSEFVGTVSEWTDWLVSCYKDLGVDTFIFWPTLEGQDEKQLRLFAEGVVPKVRESVS